MPDVYLALVTLQDRQQWVTRVPAPAPCEGFDAEEYPTDQCWRCSWPEDEHWCPRLLNLVLSPGNADCPDGPQGVLSLRCSTWGPHDQHLFEPEDDAMVWRWMDEELSARAGV